MSETTATETALADAASRVFETAAAAADAAMIGDDAEFSDLSDIAAAAAAEWAACRLGACRGCGSTGPQQRAACPPLAHGEPGRQRRET